MASGKKTKPKKASAPKRKSASKAPARKAPAKGASAARKAGPAKKTKAPAKAKAPAKKAKAAASKAKTPAKKAAGKKVAAKKAATVKKTPAKKAKAPAKKAAPAKAKAPTPKAKKVEAPGKEKAPAKKATPPAAVPVLTGPRTEAPAPAAAAKPGTVDNQIFSAITYGLFAAINKTFGTFGQSVVKNASLRILEYGYKHGWLPPKAKDPVKALQEFFGRLEGMGYAGSVKFTKKGEDVTCTLKDLAGWEAIADLRELHYPLLPIFTAELINAIVDQYFKMLVHMESVDVVPEERGLTVKFSIHERPQTVPPSKLPQVSNIDEDQFD